MIGLFKIPLISKIALFIKSFKIRVATDSGTFEAESCLKTTLTNLNNVQVLEQASLVITPNGYKENVLFSVTPSPVGTNLLQQSETFENSYWSKTRCTISANQEIAPNGSLTADYVVEDSTTGLRYVGVIGVPTTIGQTWTFSIFVKKKDRSQIGIQINEGGSLFPTVKFNFDSQSFTQTSPLMTASFQSVGNGWFRLIFTRTPTTGTSTIFGIFPLNASGDFSQTGDGVSRTIIWGAQLEYDTTVGNYIPTTTRQAINETICDFTTTRATTGTRVNSAGLIETVGNNIARLDYSNGSCPSILIEPQRTNLVFPSATATTQTRVVSAVAHTLSFYGTGSVTLSGVATGTLIGTGSSNRVRLTFTPTAGNLTLTVSGSVTDWQLEAGANATSYIPTTTTAVTRNADVISNLNGFDLIGQTEGTLYVEFNFTKSIDVYRRLFSISDNTSNNSISINLTTGGSLEVYIINGGVTQVSFLSNFLTVNTRYKIAVGYIQNNVVLYTNGTLRNTDLTCTIPTCSGVYLGKVETSGSSSFLNDSINSAMLFKTRLSNSQLQQLTTL